MPDTVVDTTATTDTLPAGTSVDVTVDTLGDHDWYAVTLVAGTTYVFHTTAIAGQNPDTFLNLRNGSGTVVASDDDGGDGTYSVLRYTAASSGTFYIDAGTYDNLSTGSYHLSMTALPPTGSDLLPASTATTGTLAVSGSIGGQIDTSGDHDWYAITLTAGETYVFRTGATTPNGTADTILTLRDAAGVQIVANDDAGEALYSAVRFTATSSGTYYLDVGAFGTTTGGFVLTAFTTPPLTVYTNDQIADQLTEGFWGGSSRQFNVAAGGTITYDVTRLTAAGIVLANEAFALWSDVTGITFSAVTSGAQIVLDDNQSGAFANSTISGGFITSSTVNVSTAWLATYGTGLNSYSFQTYIHEIGHAIGLGHAGNYNGSASYASDALYLNDAWAPTVMSYFSQTDNSYFAALGFTRQFVLTPMIADAVATTALYGTSTTTRTGDTVYGFNNTSGRAVYDATANPGVAYTVHDNGGTDTLDYSGHAQNQRIDLNAETFSNVGGGVGNVAIARGTVIERAIGGSGNDTLIGNAAANVLDGARGNDSMTGGAGDDTFFVRDAGDTVSENDGEGRDRVNAVGVNWTLGDHIEDLYLSGRPTSGTGNALGNVISASPVKNGVTLSGLGGDDDIRGSKFADTLNGGDDNDRLFGDDGDDILNGDGGNDTLKGGLGSDVLNGGEGRDILQGQAGDDDLHGGAGQDFFTGGVGLDTFFFDEPDMAGASSGTADRILDFSQLDDLIDFSAIDAIEGGGDDAFAFIGNGAFSNTAGELRFQQFAGYTMLQMDTDGDGATDYAVRLEGLFTMVQSDFVL